MCFLALGTSRNGFRWLNVIHSLTDTHSHTRSLSFGGSCTRKEEEEEEEEESTACHYFDTEG